MMRGLAVAMVVAALGAAAPASADVPATIAFTARISDSGNVAQGAYAFRFRLFGEAQGGSPVWQEGQITLTVNQGVLAHDLGSEAALTPDILGRGPLFLELEVNGVVMAPRIALRSVPYAMQAGIASSVPKAATAPVACTATEAGRVYFDTATKRFLGCDGSGYVELGARLPTRYRQRATAAVSPPNTDKSCVVTAGSPWTDVPGMEVKFKVDRPTEIELGFTGSMADQNGPTQGLHCGLRYLIDGNVLDDADPNWGHYFWSVSYYQWFGLGTERRATVTAGAHSVRVQARSGLCPPVGEEASLCYIGNGPVEPALNVLVP
jgi:hypothetical protein